MTLAVTFARLGCARIEPPEVHAGIWAMGARHRGQPLEGAQAELRVGGLPARRAAVGLAVLRNPTIPTAAEARR